MRLFTRRTPAEKHQAEIVKLNKQIEKLRDQINVLSYDIESSRIERVRVNGLLNA